MVALAQVMTNISVKQCNNVTKPIVAPARVMTSIVKQCSFTTIRCMPCDCIYVKNITKMWIKIEIVLVKNVLK